MPTCPHAGTWVSSYFQFPNVSFEASSETVRGLVAVGLRAAGSMR